MDEEEEKEIELSSKQKIALRKISEKIAKARELVRECTELADKHKVSFFVSMINHSNEYVPCEEAVNEYGERADCFEADGWQTSGC